MSAHRQHAVDLRILYVCLSIYLSVMLWYCM